MTSTLHNFVGHTPRDGLETFVGGACHNVDSLETQFVSGEAFLVFGITNCLLNSFGKGDRGGFVDKLEVEKRFGGRQRADCIGNKTKLPGTGANGFLNSFHNIMVWWEC